MCAVQSNRSNDSSRGARSVGTLRIEPVDNWHKAWRDVRKLVGKLGDGKKLRVDHDGWLSARQVLMVAFVGKPPAAYLGFIVGASKDGCVEARHVSYGIEAKYCARGIESQLFHAAVERTRALGCQSLRGFKLSSKWC